MIAKIKERKEIATDKLYVAFDLSGQNVPFKAGQFFSLTLLNPPYTDNRGNSRFLGIVNSPSQKDFFSVLTQMGVSGFKKSLAELPLGTDVDISGIDGRIHLPEDINQPVVFIAGGVGIAPIMSIIRWSKEQNWPYKLTLIYVNENRESSAFLEELETYAKENQNFKLIPVMTNTPDWTTIKSFIDSSFIKNKFPNPENNKYFITGAPRFATTMMVTLKEAGVTIPNITMELFTGY